MKVTFWLLDLNYETEDETPEIWLWGVTSSGERVLIIDKSLVAYFYAVIEETANPKKVAEEISKQQLPHIAELEVVERKFFGKPVKTVKVYCKTPDVMSAYARTLRKLEGIKDCFEDDIRFTMRYLIDNNVVPCSWHEVEVDEKSGKVKAQIGKVYLANTIPRLVEEVESPPLLVLGFSSIYYSREGSPKPERNPVVIISAATNSGEQKQFTAGDDKNDKAVIEAFTDYVRRSDPDVIIGYGNNTRDWPYLCERCRKLGLRLYVDKTQTEPHTSVYGHVSLTGRANLDLEDYSEEFPEVKVKTLANLADYLGIMKIENRTIIEDIDFAEYWEDKKRREILKQFSMDNTRCIMGIAEAILDFGIQLSSLVSIPLDHVGTAAAGFRVEWFLIKQTHKQGELVPHRVEQPYRPYAGGWFFNHSRGYTKTSLF